MWIGIILACSGPSALACEVMVKSEPFYTEEQCVKEGTQLTKSILAKGIYAKLACTEVNIGKVT
jgi:hypothetical protein